MAPPQNDGGILITPQPRTLKGQAGHSGPWPTQPTHWPGNPRVPIMDVGVEPGEPSLSRPPGFCIQCLWKTCPPCLPREQNHTQGTRTFQCCKGHLGASQGAPQTHGPPGTPRLWTGSPGQACLPQTTTWDEEDRKAAASRKPVPTEFCPPTLLRLPASKRHLVTKSSPSSPLSSWTHPVQV